mgnify:CR=1 FL=1
MAKKIIVCHKCVKVCERNSIYDAYYCFDCDIWIDRGCNDPKCEFCSVRPTRPSLHRG